MKEKEGRLGWLACSVGEKASHQHSSMLSLVDQDGLGSVNLWLIHHIQCAVIILLVS